VSTSQDRGHNQLLNRTLPICKDGQNTTLTRLRLAKYYLFAENEGRPGRSHTVTLFLGEPPMFPPEPDA
jgi:hypothetical protein